MAYPSGLNVEDATGLGVASEGVKSLASAIMPDPSKIAHAGYYGTKAREALINAAEKTNQMNLQPRFFGMIPGSGVAPVSGSYGPAPGIVNGPSIFTPSNPNIPAAAPSPLAVMVSGQTQGQAPAAAPPGPVGPPLMPPGQVATQMSAPNTPIVNQGAPPPVSPPVPGAAPAPNTTTTNGQVPQNDSQGIHPGTFTQPNDGGVKMSGPAAANGAPAPITPGIANFMAMGAAAGIPAEQMKMIGASYISDWIRTGAMDQNTGARTLAEIFDPSRVYHETAETERKNIGERGMNTRTGMEVQGRTTVANITEGGARYRHDTGEVTVASPDGNAPLVIQRKDIGGGRPGYDAQRGAAQQTAANALVNVPNPAGGYMQVPRSKALAENMTIVDAKVAEEAMAYVTVATPDGPRRKRNWEAVRDGQTPIPGSKEALQTEAGAVAGAGGKPPGPAMAAVTVPPVATGKETFDQNYNRQQTWQRYYPPTTALLQRNADGGVLPVGDLAAKVDARTAQIKAQTNLDDASAHAQAIREMQASGELPTAADVDRNRPAFYDRFTGQIGPGPDGKKYLYIDKKPDAQVSGTGAVIQDVTQNPPTPAFTGYGYQAPATAKPATPAARPATKPAGDPKARAAPGMNEGDQAQYTDTDGTKKIGIVRGGLVYAR